MKYGKRVVAVGLGLLLTSMLSLEVLGGLSDLEIEDDSGVKSTETAYTQVAQTQALELYVGKDTGTVRVKDKRNGTVWDNTVDVTDTEVSNAFIKSNLYAPIQLNYADLDSLEMAVLEVYSTENALVTVEEAEGGANTHFDFQPLGISFDVQYRLDGDSLVVTLPADKVQETTSNKIVSIKVLPLFGAAHGTDQGYVFYPDGSGAISAFSERLVTYYSNFSADVYGKDMNYLYQGDDTKETRDTCLPVFGMVKNGYAFLGSVEKGEQDARIYYDPSGYHYHLYRTYSEMVFRRPYTATLASGRVQFMIEKAGVYTDRQIRYTFFEAQNAGYSDMAVRYRRQLQQDGRLGISSLAKSAPILLEIFSGVLEERVLFNKFIPMTTFRQTETILKELTDAGAGKLLVSLQGWSKDGYGAYPASSGVASELGGVSGLKALTKTARERNIPLTLSSNYLYGDTKTGSIRMSDVIYAPGGLRPYTNMDTGSNRYLFSLPTIRSRFASDRQTFAKWGVNGIAFEAMGSTVYYDNKAKDGAARKADCAVQWQSMLEQSRQMGGLALMQGGNQYGLTQSDWLLDIAENDSGYLFATETVPFYQMVVHGSIPYSGSAINLFYDAEEQLLRQIEYGYMPTFRLTAQSPDEMLDSRYNLLFSSQYSQYKASVLDICKTWQTDFAGLSDQAIVQHVKLTATVYKTVYANGTCVYVNYSDQAAKAEGVEIAAKSYTVKGGSR